MFYEYRYEKKLEITDVEINKIEQGKELKLALDKFFKISGEYYPTLKVRLEEKCLVSVFTIDFENEDEKKILALDAYLYIKGLLRKMFPGDTVSHTCEIFETEYPALDIQIAVTRREKTDNLKCSIKESLNFFLMLSSVFKVDVRYRRYVDEESPMIGEKEYDNVVRISE